MLSPEYKLEKFLTINSDEAHKKVLSLIGDDAIGYHENFGFQWNRFNKLQLDSCNGSSESEDRLLNQSELRPEDFRDKVILEVGAGNGRFTEILLKFGAKVIAVDFSSAIFANFNNHQKYVESGKLICIRGDVFNLPVIERAFDMVLCYGVIQHTGNNEECLNTLARYVSEDHGKLLVDIYSNSLKDYNPWIYMIRPIFSRIIKEDTKRMRIVESFVNFVFPYQLKILTFLKNKHGLLKYLRYFVNRSPNSVYGINLYLDGKISLDDAKNWSICDTNDAWTPQHDDPVSFRKWKKMLQTLSAEHLLEIEVVKKCGQGNCALLNKTFKS